MKILIADDDLLILKTLEMCLKKDNYEIICSTNGIDALNKINSIEPDIIIVDIMLPHVTGLEILGKVKQSKNPIPVIVISGMEEQNIIDEAKELGADEYICKPFNISSLDRTIERLTSLQIAV